MGLLTPHFYEKHICRMPAGEWPDPVKRTFKHLNTVIYTQMQGPSEFGIGGNLANWDVSSQLKNINVPTLVIGAKYDSMDPEHMAWMSKQFPNGSYLYCANGSHMCMWDDQQTYFNGLIRFIQAIDKGEKQVAL
jgi:proline iminopeptidase